MKSRHKRLVFVLVGLAGLAVGATLVFKALNSNLQLFVSPSDLVAGKIPDGKDFRLGGLVEEGSVRRQSDGITVHFAVTDKVQSIKVTYTGILPDLFKEGQGAVALGRMGQDGFFHANEVLAKHDETYMPPEAADALKRAKERQQGAALPMNMAAEGGQ